MKTSLQTKPLGDVIIENPKSTIKVRDALSEGKYIFFRSGDKTKFTNEALCSGENIILATGGKAVVKYFEGEASYSTDTYAIKANDKEALTKYLYYFLLLNIEVIENKLFTGSTIKHLQKDGLKALDVYVPSISEQRKIVHKLDGIFKEISRAKHIADMNLHNAKELFSSSLQKTFMENKKNWEHQRLGSIAQVIGGYSFKSKDFKTMGKYQVIRMGNVRPGAIREDENPVYINEVDSGVLKRALLRADDLIITQTGTKGKRDYGFTAIINKENYLLNQRISAVRFSDKWFPKFYLYYSWTDLFRDQYFSNETGTVGQGNVGIGAITNALVPTPTLSVQKDIVKKLDLLAVETKKLERICEQKMNDLEEYRKSILNKAFHAEL